MTQQVKIASGLNIVLGAWLIMAPFVLGFTNGMARWDTMIVGVVVLILAWIRETNPMSVSGISWVNAILGAWLIIAPFILGFATQTGTVWNSILVGAGVAILGAWSALATPTTNT